MANTAYALFDKTAEKITFKYNTELTQNLNVNGLSTLSNLNVPVTATINTANITTGNVTTANVTTGNITTLNSTNATLSNIINNSFTGNIATLSNLTVYQTTSLSNLIGTTATLSNINNQSFNGNVATLSNLNVVQTTTTSNLVGTIASLSNLTSLNSTLSNLTASNAYVVNNLGIGTSTPSVAFNVSNGLVKVQNKPTIATLEYPPIAMISSPANITTAEYGNGTYGAVASTTYIGSSPVLAFNKIDTDWGPVLNSYNVTSGGTNTYSGTATTNGYAGEWIELQMPKLVQLGSFSISKSTVPGSDRGDPRDFRVYGSTDGITWVQLFEKLNEVTFNAGETKTYTVTTSNKYNYYRLAVNKLNAVGGNTGRNFTISELRYFGTTDDASVTFIETTANNVLLAKPFSTNVVNVGINNANPTERLDVVGNTKIIGNVNITGNTTTTGNATVTGNIDLGTFTSSIMKPVRYKYTTSVYSSSSPSSFTNVAELNFALGADTFYTFKALLVVHTNGAGFKLQVGLTAAQNGTIGNWTVTSLPAPSASQFVFDGNTNNIAVWTSLPFNDRNIITIEGRVWTNAADTLKINFAPNSTGVADVTYFSTIEWNSVPSWL